MEEEENVGSSPNPYEEEQPYDDQEVLPGLSPEQELTAEVVANNPWISLVKYNIERGSPISQFFDTFEQNASDPFRAAANLSIGFNDKIRGMETHTQRSQLEFVVGSQADRLASTVTSYDAEMRRATSYMVGGQRRDIYESPSGFLSRPTQYDTYSLLANEEASGMRLRMSMYQLQEINTVVGINQRRSSTEIITQSFLDSPTSQQNLDDSNVQRSMKVLLGNDVSLNLLRRNPNITAYGVSMPEMSNLHAKVGYLSDNAGVAQTAFISTQNITSALSRAHTSEEMLVLRRGDIYRSNYQNPSSGLPEFDRREGVRGQLIDELKAVTDAISYVAEQQGRMRAGVDGILQSMRLQRPQIESFAKQVKQRTNQTIAGMYGPQLKEAKSVFVNDEIQLKILESIQSLVRDPSRTKKVVLSIQYLEQIFYEDRGSAGVNNALQMDLHGGSDYYNRIRKPFIGALGVLAERGQLSIGTSATSFGTSQGLFALLDAYHGYGGRSINADSRRVLETLLRNESFSLLPTKFAHSKSFAIIDDAGGMPILDTFGIGSANFTYNAYANNVEASLIVSGGQLAGLTDREQQEIASYYYHGVSNFRRRGQQGSFTERRGNAQQTEELVRLLTSMGGIESRIGSGPFSFSRRYDVNRGGSLSGLDITIGGLGDGSKGYSFSVTVGQEFGQKGYEPVVYLSKNNRVVNGMIYKNNSKEVLKLYNGDQLAPGETRQLSAIDVVGGLVSTMQHSMRFEAGRRSLQLAVSSMSTSARQAALSTVLGSMFKEQLQLASLGRWDSIKGSTFQDVLAGVARQSPARGFFSSLFGRGNKALGAMDALEALSRRLELPLAESSLGIEPGVRLAERAGRISGAFNIGQLGGRPAEAYSQAVSIIQQLDRVMMSSLGNTRTATLYSDILRKVVQSDDVASDVYARSQRAAKRDVFSQITSAFMQPHELRYSFGQALYKRPVYGMTDDIYALAEGQGTLGLILSPYALRHGESLGGSYQRAIADSVRVIERNAFHTLGGIYKAEGGPAAIRSTEELLSTMRGIGVLRRGDYAQQSLEAFEAIGLDSETARRRAQEQEIQVFQLLGLRESSSSSLFYFPYRVTEQISARLKNLQSGRPVEAASRAFGMYADTLGVAGSTSDPLALENMLSGNLLTSLPEHQFRYLQELIAKHSGNAQSVIEDIRNNINGDSLSLVRGLLGGSSPKRVLQSVGISTMSDFAYINAGYRDANGERPEYALLHRSTLTFDTKRLMSNTSFQERVSKVLTKGVTFLAKDALIEDAGLRGYLEGVVASDAAAILGKSGSYAELMGELDRSQLRQLEQLITSRYESVQFKAGLGEFYFRKGVHATATGTDYDERLSSKRMIGQLEESSGYFTLNGFYEYGSTGGSQRNTQLIKFKLPAVSQREYRGVSVLYEDARIAHSGGSTISLELNTSTRRDMMSGLRYGSDTSKGPNYMLQEAYFNALEELSGTSSGLLPARIRNQSIYSVLSPSQIKGFNFEQGLMLIEDRGSSRFLDFVRGRHGGGAIAEGLALMMLKEQVGGRSISQLLGERLQGIEGRSQASIALLRDGASYGKALPVRGTGGTVTDATAGTFMIYGELGSLALPRLLNDSSRTISQALVETVGLALQHGQAGEEAREHLRTTSLRMFDRTRERSHKLLNDRYVFNDSFDSRSASVLAYTVKAAQDLFGDINLDARLNSPALSEINPGFFLKNRAAYFGDIPDYDPRARQALVSSVRRVSAGLNIHLPSPEEILAAQGGQRDYLDRRLTYGLTQVNAMLRFNRFLEFGVEQLPSKIAVAVGMQNMTKMEGQYALELSKRQMGLYTNTFQERQDILSIHQSVLMLGSLMEGQLPDPYRASSVYGMSVRNLAVHDQYAGVSEAMRFSTSFLSNFSRVAEKTLPTVISSQGGTRELGLTSPIAEDAVRAFVLGQDADARRLVGKMGLVRNLVGGLVMSASKDGNYGIDTRRRLLEQHILYNLQNDQGQVGAIRSEVVGILQDFEAVDGPLAGMTHEHVAPEIRRIVRQRVVTAQREGRRLIAPSAYYENLFTNLSTQVFINQSGNPWSQDGTDSIHSYITEDLLRSSGVYEHYQDDLNRRISASQNTEPGTEYLHYGMEVLRSLSHAYRGRGGRAQELYQTITRTQRLVLPALTSLGMEGGKHRVAYMPTDKATPNQGLLLGLDLMQKMSLVFQGQSHAALSTQVALSEHLSANYKLLQKLSQGVVELDEHELQQYRRLEYLMHESIESTTQLLNNQETIRQAAADRMKLSGMSAIAMSSLLLNDDEVAFGSRFNDVTGKGEVAQHIKSELYVMRKAIQEQLKPFRHTAYLERALVSAVGSKGSLQTGYEFQRLANLIVRGRGLERRYNEIDELVTGARSDDGLSLDQLRTLRGYTGKINRRILRHMGLELEQDPIEFYNEGLTEDGLSLIEVIRPKARQIAEYPARARTIANNRGIDRFEKILKRQILREYQPLGAEIQKQERKIAALQGLWRKYANETGRDTILSSHDLALSSTATALNEMRRDYYQWQHGSSLPENEFITKEHLYSVIDDQLRTVDQVTFNDYAARLITSKSLNDIQLPNGVKGSKEVLARGNTMLQAVEQRLLSQSTTLRQGAPFGTSLLSRSGTALVNVIGAEGELTNRARSSGTLVTPDERSSRTLMLVSALGMHYTQMGDNDGDSFQGAVTQLAAITRRIKQQEEHLKRLNRGRSQHIHDSSLSKADLNGLNSDEQKIAEQELKALLTHKDELLEEHKKIKANAKDRAVEGLRKFTTTYTAIPSEMMGAGGALPDDSLQSLVKQYRDTLDGVYGNTKHAVQAIGSLDHQTIAGMQLSRTDNGFELTSVHGNAPSASQIREFDYYQQTMRNAGLMTTDEEIFKQQLIEHQAIAANTGAAISVVADKQMGSAIGSILDAQGQEELQSILGASGTGLLGSTYNTIVPLVALKMGEVVSQKTLRGSEGAAYRMAMAAGLSREIQRVRQHRMSDPSNTTLALLEQQLVTKRSSYFEQRETLATRLRQHAAQRDVEAAMRFVSTTQQFLRDAAIKPKEGAKTTLLTEAAEYTMSADDYKNYGVRLPEGQTSIRGLSNILSNLTGSDKVVRDNREAILTRFLGERVGNDLSIFTGRGSNGQMEVSQVRAFAALKLMTEFVSDRFEDATGMMSHSVFSGVLNKAKQLDQYKGLTDEAFIPKFISHLTSGFQSSYILDNVMELDKRYEFAGKGRGILDLYGVRQDGRHDSGAIDNLVNRKRVELLDGVVATPAEERMLDDHLAGYRNELIARQEAIAEATGGLTDDFEIFKGATRAVVNSTIQADQERLEGSFIELKALHGAIGDIRRGDVPSNLEQDLGLYSTAFTQQLASGKIDANIWSGFYAQALPQIADIAGQERTSPAGQRAFFSMLGLGGTSAEYDMVGAEASAEYQASMTRAATHYLSVPEQQVDLAIEYTQHMAGSAFSVDDARTQIASSGESGLSDSTRQLLGGMSGLSGDRLETYHAGLEAIATLPMNQSAAEVVANQSAFTYSMNKLGQEYVGLVSDQQEALRNAGLDQTQRDSLNLQYEQAINRVQEQMTLARENARGSLVSSEAIQSTIQGIQQSLNENLTAAINQGRAREVERVSTQQRRAQGISEAIGVLAVPAIFGMMQSKGSFNEQLIEGASLAGQSYLSSAGAMYGGGAEAAARVISAARIRSNLLMGGGKTESLLTGTAYEAIFHTGSLIANEAMREVGGFAATPVGELAGGVAGGVIGMGLAGLITNRRVGLPGETVTEQNMADRILEGIRQSTRMAAERFDEMVVAQASAEVFDGDDGGQVDTELSSSDFKGDRLLSNMELDELTGVSLTTYEGEDVPVWRES